MSDRHDAGKEAYEFGSPRLLCGEEKRECRSLWEKIFAEDSSSFLDYYDRWKYTDNECYGIYAGDTLISMVQLNPYRMEVRPGGTSGHTVESRYIIAVATREEYRHRGLMRRLLHRSLEDMRKKNMPFVFLMPASEAIYYPFGFRFFYEMNTGRLKTEEPVPCSRLKARLAEASDIPALVRLAEKLQDGQFDFYTKRDNHYFEMLFDELASEGGGLLLLERAAAEDDGPEQTGNIGRMDRMMAAVPFWGREPVEIREILCRAEDREDILRALRRWFFNGQEAELPVSGAAFSMEGTKPIIMGRITDAKAFLELFSAEKVMELCLSLTDSFLEENSGLYRWKLGPEGSRAERLEDGHADVSCTAEELFLWLACGKRAAGFPEDVRMCRRPFINEIV